MNSSVYKPVAVMMCVYKNDNAIFLKEAIDSILNQRGITSHLYLFVDGPLPEPLDSCLKSYEENINCFFTFSKYNIGLASGLNYLVDNSIDLERYDYIARMDADDISEPHRLMTQVEFFCGNSDISVLGSDVVEISESGDEIFYKKMDEKHDDLFLKIIKKCPFNHPSVMFDASVFKEGYRYKSELKNTQDYYLWVDLLAAGKKFHNINSPLVKFRVDSNFHSRRGLKKAINDLKSRVYAFKKLDVMSLGNVIHTFLLFFLRLSPSFIKKMAYKIFR